MAKIENIEVVSDDMRKGAICTVLQAFVDANQAFSKYDVTLGVRALLGEIADFKHAEVRDFIGECITNCDDSGGVKFDPSIIDGPTGKYVLYTLVDDDTGDVPVDGTVDDAVEDTGYSVGDAVFKYITEALSDLSSVVVSHPADNLFQLELIDGRTINIKMIDDCIFDTAIVYDGDNEVGVYNTLDDVFADVEAFDGYLSDINYLGCAKSADTNVTDNMSSIRDTITNTLSNIGLEVERIEYVESKQLVFTARLKHFSEFITYALNATTFELITAFVFGGDNSLIVGGITYSEIAEKARDAINGLYSQVEPTVEPTVAPTASRRVYISKEYVTNAGYAVGTPLKVSVKNGTSIAITEAKNGEYTYIVNADGRIRINESYLKSIGLNIDNVNITAYPKLIIISNA